VLATVESGGRKEWLAKGGGGGDEAAELRSFGGVARAPFAEMLAADEEMVASARPMLVSGFGS